jgi:lipoprotein-releasing system permease protein
VKTFLRFAGPACGVAFAVLAYWAYRHPAPLDPLGLPRLNPVPAVAAVTGALFVLWLVVLLLGRVLGRVARAIGRLVWRVAGPAVGVAFAALTYWTIRLPVLRGSMWTLKDTLVRASAVATGILFVLWVLARLVPVVLNWLEGRAFESFVAARHVRAQKSGFLTVISVLSICGVAVSACAQSSVVSVLGGFSHDLRRKILGNNAHIVVDAESQAAWGGSEEVLQRIRATPGVLAATPVVIGEVMVSSPSNLAGVFVRGVDPTSIGSVIDLVKNIEVGRFEYLEAPEKLLTLPPDEVIGIGPGGEQYLKGVDLPILSMDDPRGLLSDPMVRAALKGPPLRPGIVIGRELAKTLHVYLGDELTLVSPLGDLGPMGVMPRTKKFRVAAIFFSGMYEYDSSHVYTLIDVARSYLDLGDKVSAVDIKVEDADRADEVAKALEPAIGRPDLHVRDWREINKTLFGALKLERFATFVILSVLTIVASFCIICTLLLMVTEKGKEIAILKALGASDASILRIFMTEGVIIGAIGTAFGVTTGLAMCTGLLWFGLRLDPDVYYIDRLPINVSAVDFLIVAVLAITICTVATLYPAKAASKLRPVDALRYE